MTTRTTHHAPLIRRASFLFLCTFLFSFLGCSSQSSQSAKQPEITIWHWMTDRGPAFEVLGKRYQEKTGIKINFELYAPSDAYTQKVRAAAQGQNLPDIFGILGEKRDFASFIKAGHILDLTSFMNADNAKWRNGFFPKALAVNEFPEGNSYGVNPGIYGAPIDMMAIKMVYNKNLFKRLGISKPPATFEEFIALGKEIKDSGLQGLVSGWGELWMIDCFANNYAFNIMGKDKVLATIRGESPYNDPDWIKVLSVFKRMRDSGILSSGLITMVNKTAEQLFASDKAVFAFNGSWCVNVYKGMNPEINYGVIMLPQASDKFPMSMWAGAGSSFMVSARSANKEAAVKFLEWLTEAPQQAYLSEATNNLPANKDSVKKIPNILSQFSDGMDQATHPNVWGVSEYPAVIEALDKGIQSIILGERSPEDVANYVQQVKVRELAKRKK